VRITNNDIEISVFAQIDAGRRYATCGGSMARRAAGRWRDVRRVDGATRCRSMARCAAGRWRDALPVDGAVCGGPMARRAMRR
jgi:hypothetical protein